MHVAPLTLLLLLTGNPAYGHPNEGPQAVCDAYPTSPTCSDGTTSCLICHVAPPELNLYGAEVRDALGPGDRAQSLGEALAAVEPGDADRDGWTNLEELIGGMFPGDPLSTHALTPPSEDAVTSEAYLHGQYDAAFALRRVETAFCGEGPSFEEVAAVAAADNPREVLHGALEECLASDYWRREAIPRLADSKIRPLVALGTCETMLADFEYDYRLFAYVMTGGRDARDLVLANYHVARDTNGELAVIDEAVSPIEAPAFRAGLPCRDPFGNSPPVPGGQPLAPEHRAGMLTTQWFLVIQTQASYLPRTTAAAAYRAWLGFDISRFEGLFPVAGEPRDIDAIGIDASPCYQCHSTLDPLAYAFAYYNGIGFNGIPGMGEPLIGTYDRERPTTFFLGPQVARDAWAADPPLAYALGDPMPAEATLESSTGLVVMAERFSTSDAFANNIARMIWAHAMGHAVGPTEQVEFAAVVSALRDAEYSVDALAHAIIDTEAFGAP